MRDEIEKLIAEIESNDQKGWRAFGDLRVASGLRRILNADPVSKLEAMGYTVVLTGEGATVELCAASNNEELLFRESMGRYVAPAAIAQAAIAQAATRLLARIEEACDGK